MQLQEYQAKKLLSRYAIPTPPGFLALTPDEAEVAATRLDSGNLFVKAQIPAGDRAVAGGISAVRSAAEARSVAKKLLGQRLVTSQTGPHGSMVRNVLVERCIEAGREFYLALNIDTAAAAVTVTAGQDGGVGIEGRVTVKSVELETLLLGVNGERHAGDIVELGRRIGLPDAASEKFRAVVERLHRAFVELDAGMIEINPLVLTGSGDFVAVDAKVLVDDNAMFRHPDLCELREEMESDQTELQAQQHQINFVQMDGDIGTVVNGAGLGLATLDMIRLAGGAPANFMDIRTTAQSLDIAHGIGLVLDNPRARVLLVNVFGGGMQPCDTIADGLGIAYRRHPRRLPIVVRITGNNADLARLRLANYNLPKTECSDMWQAVTRALEVAQGRA